MDMGKTMFPQKRVFFIHLHCAFAFVKQPYGGAG